MKRIRIEEVQKDAKKMTLRCEAKSEMARNLKVKAEVSVAACLSDSKGEVFRDRVSVMLPLPILPSTKSGLPVLVNGFFALGESR